MPVLTASPVPPAPNSGVPGCRVCLWPFCAMSPLYTGSYIHYWEDTPRHCECSARLPLGWHRMRWPSREELQLYSQPHSHTMEVPAGMGPAPDGGFPSDTRWGWAGAGGGPRGRSPLLLYAKARPGPLGEGEGQGLGLQVAVWPSAHPMATARTLWRVRPVNADHPHRRQEAHLLGPRPRRSHSQGLHLLTTGPRKGRSPPF